MKFKTAEESKTIKEPLSLLRVQSSKTVASSVQRAAQLEIEEGIYKLFN
jgi:hypothetical protein